MERHVDQALRAAGDPAGATAWRQALAELGGELRVAVLSAQGGTGARLARTLADRGAQTVVLQVDPEADALPLGAEDRLFGAHALVWATPLTAPLGAAERLFLPRIAALAPARRVVVLADVHLLDQLSDDPAREASEVLDRLEGLVPEGWSLLEPDSLQSWVDELRRDLPDLVGARSAEVAGILLRDALERIEEACTRERSAIEEIEGLLAQEDAALDRIRREGERTASHLLASMRRRTEELLLDLRAFLDGLHDDVRPQVEAIDELETVRRTLPHWVHHVVEGFLIDRLGQWRAEVLTDLRIARVDPADAERASLLVPALHAAPLSSSGGWRQRLGVTAAVGGGAAMLFLGLWIPGVVALAGGLTWSALGRQARRSATREHLIDAACTAVRRMGEDADRLMRDQLLHMEAELAALGTERAQDHASAREEERKRIEERLAFHRAGHADQVAVRDDLLGRMAVIDPGTGGE